MDNQYYVGIDISKGTLDWAVFDGRSIVFCTSTDNSAPGIKSALNQIRGIPGLLPQQTVFCMEHTGIYNAHLLGFLHKADLPVWLENSTQIKQASGMQRGKSDSIDARRIAEYAFRFRDRTRLWEPPRQVVQQLAFLSAARQRLIQAHKLLAVPLAEQESFVGATLQKQIRSTSKKSLVAIKDEMKAIDAQIKALIQGDKRLKELFDLIVSVPGAGPATATEILVSTNEMKAITSAKKMACHAGVAPFEYSSGSSIRGRTRVSHQARKRLKSLFHLGAMSAIQRRGELQDYYQRKVAEGKNRMLVLNAVRNKIIHRIYAAVARGEKYDGNYIVNLA